MSACSSFLQALHQRNLFNALNGIQVLDNQNTNLASELSFALLVTVLCYLSGALWIKKDFIALSFYELEPIIILLYIAPILLMPVIFLKFRTDSYNAIYILPILPVMFGFLISIHTTNIWPQILLMIFSVSLILFVTKKVN